MAIGVRSGPVAADARRMLAPKIFYFCFYAAGSALMPYLGLYYQSLGLTGRYIGLLTGIPPLVTLFAAPLWGSVADATQRHRQMLLTAIGSTIVVVLALSLAAQLLWLLPLVMAYAFFSAPIVPLVDNTTLAMLGPRKDQYGRQRVWGAIGWGVSAAVMGVVIQRVGLHAAFYGYAVFLGLGFVAATRLPVASAGIGNRFWSGLRVLLRNRVWIAFLLAVLSSSISAGMYNNFLFVYLNQLGAPATLMGLSLVMATFSELPVFFFSDKLLKRWAPRGVLIMALAASAVRMFAYAAMPAAWWVLLIHLLLHGLSFSAMWAAGVANADALAPEGMGATAQGMFAGVTFGIGASAGALLAGLLYESIGPARMFAVGGIIVLAGLLLYVVAGRTPAARSS